MAGHFSSLLDQPAPDAPRIPVTVLTGFLGSGKTTLLNRVIRLPEMTGTAVVVNEFGEVGIDHDLIEQATEDTVLLPNGCLCCAVRGDLVHALTGLAQRPGGAPARVLLETSGLADPGPILRTLMADPALRNRYVLAAVACTADAVLGLKTLEQQPEAERQLAMADHVFVTKTDLVTPDAWQPLLDRLRETTATIHTDPSTYPGTLLCLMHSPLPPLGGGREGDPAALADPRPPAPTPLRQAQDRPSLPQGGREEAPLWLRPVMAAQPTPSLHRAGITSIVLTRDQPIPRAGLAAWLDMLVAARGDELLRVKGLVCIEEHPDQPLVVHGVQHLFHPPEVLPRWPSADHRTRIVLIGLGLDAQALDETLAVFARRRRRPAGTPTTLHNPLETP